MGKQHQYPVSLKWTGNTGEGTSHYRAYKRDFTISVANKALLQGSSDPSFRGDPTKYNPEEMLVASLSSCHMLWFLHLCADAGIIVLEYTDQATGIMEEDAERGGFFKEVILRPRVRISDPSRYEECSQLHKKANSMCFIANSMNFPVRHEAGGEESSE